MSGAVATVRAEALRMIQQIAIVLAPPTRATSIFPSGMQKLARKKKEPMAAMQELGVPIRMAKRMMTISPKQMYERPLMELKRL